MNLSKLFFPGLALALAGGAFAQSDDCSTATAIGTIGAFAFDTSALTTSTFDGGGTCAAGASTINQDAFWQWTAPAAGNYVFDTFGTTFDTKLSVHAGVGCAATCASYDDDTGSPQSQVTMTGLAMGDAVLIQVGGFGTASGPGTLNISNDPCAGIVDDAFEDNDDCLSAVPLAVGLHPGLVATDTDADFYAITIATGDILQAAYVANVGDIDFSVYDASCALIGNAGLGFTYANITGAPETVIVECKVNPINPLSCADYDLDLSTSPDPCQAGPDDAFEDNDDCAAATPMVDGSYPGLFASSYDKDHYSFCVADGNTVDIDAFFTTSTGDMDIVLWNAADANCGTGHAGVSFLAEGWSATDDETISWTNSTGADLDVILEVNLFNGASCNNYDLVIVGAGCGSGGVGTPFCSPNSSNSTGSPAVLAGTLGTGVGSDLHLEITGGVAGQLAYLLVGNEATAGIVVSNGQFCLVGTPTAQFFRFNVAGTDMNSIGGFDATGTWINVSGTSTTGFGFDVPSTIPDSVPVPIMAGDTWHFQGWYRDTPAGPGQSNFTNGLSVTF